MNICSEIKVIGGMFTNKGSLENINSSLVKSRFMGKLMENWGIRGTLSQRVYFINTFCLSKMNFLSQVFKIDSKVIREIKTKALQFVYVGYNERPVQVLNFRGREEGGLGLIEPGLKAQSLLLHHMYREFQERNISLVSGVPDKEMYGPKNKFTEMINGQGSRMSSKEIYVTLRAQFTRVHTSLIPSRIEKKMTGIKWTRSYKNLYSLGTLSAKEKEFGFMLLQDLLPFRGRIHRANADKRCLRRGPTGECQHIQDRIHYFIGCTSVISIFSMFREILWQFLKRKVDDLEILHLSFSVTNKRRTRIGIWLALKFMFYLFSENLLDFKAVMMKIRYDFGLYKKIQGILFMSSEFEDLEELVNKATRC